MASVSGIMEQARAYLPGLVSRRRRGSQQNRRTDSVAVPMLRPDTLTDLIAQHVIPRLVTAHSTDHSANGATVARPASVRDDLDAFATLAIDADSDVLLMHLDDLLSRGATIDSLLLDLLAPTARRLGELWEEDRCDFVDVTMGLWRLQEAVRELSGRVPALQSATFGAKRALFATMPGEQHSFGTVLIEDIFRRDGWATELLTDVDNSGLLDAIARQSFDVVGLTLSCDGNIGRLHSLILAMRSVSRNPRLCIMVGGRALVADPEISTRVGADGTAPDAQRALAVASGLVAMNACREVFCA